MTYRNGSRFSAVVAMTAVMIGVVGGGAVASNMGFKLNKPLAFFQPPPAPTTSVGDNWTSLPFSNPYTNIGSFCSQLGLTSTGVIGAPRAMVSTTTAQATNLVLGEAVRMREPNGPKIFVPAHF